MITMPHGPMDVKFIYFIYFLSFFLSYSYNRVLLEKLNASKLVKKLPPFCGTQRFITTFTRARHLSQF